MGFYRLRVASLSVGLLGLVSCKGSPGPGIKLQVAESASQHACIKTDKSGFPLAAVLREGTVRLSVLQKQGSSWQFQCDLTAKLPDEHPSIDLGAVDRNQYAFFAELFDPAGQRVLTGALQGKSSVSADGGPGILPMFEVESWNCPASGMVAARGFHSATALPGGEVLIYGGVETGVSAGNAESMGVTDTVELYEPSKAAFQVVTVSGKGPLPRAFHQTAVLSATDTQVKLMVFGGITAPRGRQVLTTPITDAPLRLAPCGEAAPAGAEILTLKSDGTKWTVTSDAVAQTDVAGFAGTAALSQGGLVSIGGSKFSSMPPCTSTIYVDLLKPTAGTPVQKAVAWSGQSGEVYGQTALTTGFLAPSLTPISKRAALAIGGAWPASAAMDPPMTALLLTGIPEAPTATAAMGQTLMGVPTAFHTATRIGGALGDSPTYPVDVLLTGGFQMTDSSTPAPGQPPAAASAVRVYSVKDDTSAPTLRAVTPYLPGACGSAQPHYRAASYEAASATASGQRVVITGGTATQVSGCNDCESSADTSLLCTLSQASEYDSGKNSFRQLPAMAMARFGHQQTLLQDGGILVTGGLTRKVGKTTEATSESEIYNPRASSTATADLDDPVTLSLPAGEQASRVGVDARNPCTHL
jgi:hypothetical protein